MSRPIASAVLASLWGWTTSPVAAQTTFSNPAPITIPANAPNASLGPAAPYPSTIVVADVVDPVIDVNITITGLTHSYSDDVDFLLVGPSGATVMLMAGCGGSTNLNNINITFDDEAAGFLPNTSPPLVSGVYKPSNYEPLQTMPVPAPLPPFGSTLSAFDGINPNGTWKLYAADDGLIDYGALNLGWAIEFTLEEPPANCQGDIVPTLVVDVDDLIAVINSWGPCEGKCPADIAPAKPDGQVNVDDLLMVINAWGPCK